MRRNQQAWCAEPALQSVVLAKALLQFRKFADWRYALDSCDLVTIKLASEQQARACRRTIEKNGAGAAYTVLTSHVRPGQLQVPAQEVDEGKARFDRGLDGLAVDLQ